jgi:RNA polymerase sigma factor (sigma-70 family)
MYIEQEILDGCMSGDKRAQRALHKACFPFLMKVCRLYSRDDQEAMSFFNGGFYKILKGLKRRKKNIPYHLWARKVMVNSIIDDYRKHKKYRKNEIAVEDFLVYENTHTNFDSDLADLIFEADEIIEMIRELPEMTAKVFMLFAVEEIKYSEIADKLSITESTVRWHVSTARKKLMDRMEVASSKKKVAHE